MFQVRVASIAGDRGLGGAEVLELEGPRAAKGKGEKMAY